MQPEQQARHEQGDGRHMLGPTAHVDTFTRDNLPPPQEWPDFLLDGFDYPDRLNAAVELTDAMVAKGVGDRTALIGNGRRRTYKELSDWTNRLAHALVENYGVKPGNRVLIRSANNPAMVACWLAATKAGAVVVNTMPMLRFEEVGAIGPLQRIANNRADDVGEYQYADIDGYVRGSARSETPARGRQDESGRAAG